MKIIDGGITAAKGFSATGAAIGIKKGIKDLALVASDVPAIMAGCFTTNIVKAASVLRNTEILKNKNTIRGIAINSGNANACTGEAGVAANIEMAEAFAQELGALEEEILTASTGVIGAAFPIGIIKDGIHKTAKNLGNTRADAILAAEGIMTTDTYSKEIAIEFEIDGVTVTMGGMAKGSGMIHPNMATMLGFVTTDMAISQQLMQKALSETVTDTYNMVSVDGDTSTNDTIVVLANGLAKNTPITMEDKNYEVFKKALHFVNEKLAKDLVRDGEGATKFIEVNVKGTKTYEDAKTVAKSVVTSNLFKAAIFGEDANWGRVLCAMGYSGVIFDPTAVDIDFESQKGNIKLMDCGTPIVFDEERAKEILGEQEIKVNILLREGEEKATAWGCDLSYEYVKINGDYRS